jgi:uracil-DNA glycosylase
VTGPYGAEARAFIADGGGGWAALSFFRSGLAVELADRIDRLAASGRHVLPPAPDVFAALRLTPPRTVRVVILGQDPYPTPGDAHGLAFSVRAGARIPRSLGNIFRELAADVGGAAPASGSLIAWAKRGVLLLNACLTVEAGAAGAHRGLGWEALTDEVVAHVSAGEDGAVFVLWGADAQGKRALIDHSRHLVIATAHPSPLSARRGFMGSKPFSRADAWLTAQGRAPMDWRL